MGSRGQLRGQGWGWVRGKRSGCWQEGRVFGGLSEHMMACWPQGESGGWGCSGGAREVSQGEGGPHTSWRSGPRRVEEVKECGKGESPRLQAISLGTKPGGV